MRYNMAVFVFSFTIFLSVYPSPTFATRVCDCGTLGHETECCWEIDEKGNLSITSGINPETGAHYENVAMADYRCDDSTVIGNRPWEQYMNQIKNIVVGDNITNISRNAFQGAYNLETVTGMKDVKSLGFDSFAYDNKLKLVEMPSVEFIDKYALSFSSITSVDLPKIKHIAHGFGNKIEYVGLPEWDVIFEDANFTGSGIPECSNENRAACGSCGDNYIKSGIGCVSDCGENFLVKEGRCIDADLGCGAEYSESYGYCYRVRYTLPEADEATSDDNENTIEWIFE